MKCRIADLRNKEVVNICDGMRLGYVCDVMLNTVSGQVVAIVVPGPFSFWSLIGCGSEWIVPWECVKRIGDDLIMVEARELRPTESKRFTRH